MPTLSQQCCLYQPCGSSVSIELVCDCGLAIEHCQHQLCHISISYVTSASSLSVIVDLPLNIVSISYVTSASSLSVIVDLPLNIVSISYVTTSVSVMSQHQCQPLNIVSISYVTTSVSAVEHCQHQLCHNISIKPVCDCGLASD